MYAKVIIVCVSTTIKTKKINLLHNSYTSKADNKYFVYFFEIQN